MTGLPRRLEVVVIVGVGIDCPTSIPRYGCARMKYEYDARRDGCKMEGAKGGREFGDEIKTDYSKVRNETRGCRCRKKGK